MLWTTDGKEIVYVSYDNCKTWKKYNGNLHDFISSELDPDLYEIYYGVNIPDNEEAQIELCHCTQKLEGHTWKDIQRIFNYPDEVIEWYTEQ